MLAGNALKYADRCALEAGFCRCASRAGVLNSRTGSFVRDVPKTSGDAKWCFYDAAGELHLPDSLRVAP